MDRLDEIREIRRKYNNPEERHKRMVELFNALKPFKKLDDIPEIPITDKETYNNIIVPNLIRCGAIPKDKLIIGETYIGTCRNSSEATWNGNEFEYKRYKLGYYFNDTINHFQDDDGYDVFVPVILNQ